MPTSVTMEGTPTTALAGIVRDAFDAAINHRVTVDPGVLAMPGMSGRTYRAFVNDLMARLAPDGRYLEVGAHAGSTLCSAISGNAVRAVTIDNWSQFGGPRELFFEHLARFGGASDVRVIEEDFRKVDYASLGTFNVFLFDGPHEEVDQYDGVILAQPALDRVHVLVVDDWNRDHIRRGTRRGLAALSIDIPYVVEIRTTQDGSHPEVAGAESEWHNGYLVAVVEKR